jgi:uncharacterized repeat protein (TIGR01451 family)
MRFRMISWRSAWLAAALALLSSAAGAVTFGFSGTVGGTDYPVCNSGSWSASGSTYTCSQSITLAAGDAILPAGGITVVAAGGIDLQGGNAVGSVGAPVALESSWGAITATAGAIYGNLTSGNGAINLTNTSVAGGIVTGGTVSLSGGSVSGNVTGNNGVTTTSGPIVGGNVSAGSGGISLSGGSVGGSVHSGCCIVTTSGTNIGNGVSSSSNSVVISGGTIAGAISSNGGSGISINGATVGSGSISAVAGSIDIGNCTIGANGTNVNITSTNNVNLSGSTTVRGNVTAAGWPGSLSISSPSRVLGTCSPPHPLCQTSVTLSKTASSTASLFNSYISFEIVATNETGAALGNIEITDVLPAGMTPSANSATTGTVTVSGQTVTWIIPSLSPGQAGTLTLVVQLTQKGSLTNTVSSSGSIAASATVLVLPKAITTYAMDEPVGSWNGTIGEVIDSGGNKLHGHRRDATTSTTNTVAPSPTIASQFPAVSGGFCNAGDFDGNAVVESASSPYFQFTNVMSASAWIYPTAYPDGTVSDVYSILSNDVNYEFHINPQGQLFWWWGLDSFASAASIPLNQWSHIAITMDSTAANARQRIYINGVLDANTRHWSGTLLTNNCPFYIGGDISSDGDCALMPQRSFRGMIDEVSIYDYEMTAAEVQAAMKLGRRCSGTFDHVEIHHDGSASTCAAKSVTLKACLDAGCTVLYPGTVMVQLSPSGWTPSDVVSFSGGVATATLANTALIAPSVALGTISVTPAPANATTCHNGATQSCTLDVMPSSCLADAVEVGGDPHTNIYTKLAGTPFNVDVLAVSGNAVNTLYTGTMTVDAIDANSGCSASSIPLNASQAVTLAASDMGRKTVSMSSNVASRKAQIRIKVGSDYACSTDKFAIRPMAFVLGSTMNADVGGGSASATPTGKAGANFPLTAIAGAGYDGTPVLDATKVVVLSGSKGALSGVFLAADPGTGTSTGAAFTYGEVGYFGLSTDGVVDSDFTAVDQPNDCTGDSSYTLTGGKYGCKIGSAASEYFGRFIPDHFDTTVTQGCAAGAFTYSAQPFDLTVTARNLAGTTTANYDGGTFAKKVNLSDANALAGGTLSPADVAGAKFKGGVAATTRTDVPPPSYAFARTSPDPAPGTIKLRATDTDGASSATGTEGEASIRIGRLRLSNVYGYRSPLRMPVEAQYWTGNSWVRNADDTCTALVPGNLAVSSASWSATAISLSAGTGSITLVPTAAGSTTVCADLADDPTGGVVCSATRAALPWLQSRWPPGPNFDNDPAAVATFGVFSPESKRGIYNREMY